MNCYFEKNLKTISDSLKTMDEKKFDELINHCTQIVLKGGKIIASGLGKNVPVCEKFVGTLNSLGINASFLHTNTAMHGDLGIVKENDIVLLLTKSGNTQESILLASQLITRGTETWLLSFNSSSRLYDMIKYSIILDLKNEGDEWDIVPNNSTSVYLILLQGIAIILSKCLGIDLDRFKNNHPGGRIGEILGGME